MICLEHRVCPRCQHVVKGLWKWLDLYLCDECLVEYEGAGLPADIWWPAEQVAA